MKPVILLFALYAMLWPLTTLGQEPSPPVDMAKRVSSQELIGHIDAMLDESGKLAIGDVVSERFAPVAGRGVDFGYTPGTVWLRASLRNATEDVREWRVHFRENFMPYMAMWAVAPDGRSQLIDEITPTSTFEERLVSYPEVTFPLELAPGETTTIYVAYRSDGSTQTSFEIRSRADFSSYAAKRTARNFVFYGMILFLVIAATIAFMLTRLSVFAAYGMYAGAALMFMLHADGNAFQYLWPTAPAFNNFASILTGAGFIVTGANFARQFLQTAQLHPVMDRLLLGLMLFTVGLVVSTIGIETQLIKKTFVLLAFFSVLLFTLAGLVAARTRFREVRFYVVAWTGAVIASGIMTSRHWLGIDIPEDTQLDAMRMVMVVDAAFMGLAILDRFNQLKQARQQALEANLTQAQRSLDMATRLQVLEKQYAIAAELAESRGRKLSDTAHDLRQPLHALRLSVQSMMNAPGPEGPKAEDVEKTFAYLEALVASELNERGPGAPAARGDAGSDEPARAAAAAEPVAIGEVLESVGEMFAADADEKGLRLTVMPTRARTTLPALAMMRIASNLVSNAIKYTPSGRVVVGVRRRGGAWRLEVHDTGPGMTAEEFRSARERAVRLAGAEKQASGSGLGLSIVHEMADKHGLEVALLGRHSPGTSICISLPAA